MVALLMEALFSLVFLRALGSYVRRRDPLQRDVTLVFTAMAMIFMLDLLRRILGLAVLPVAISYPVIVVLLAQPYLTLRLVRSLRPVPRWLMWGSFCLFVATTVPLLVFAQLKLVWLTVVVVLAFAAVQTAAAALLLAEARGRVGAPRIRLIVAATSTVLLGMALLVSGAGSSSGHAAGAHSVTQAVAMLSAVGYAIAFLPPAWLRRFWEAAATQAVRQRLMGGAATESPAETWQRYATTVCEAVGADAALVLLPSGGQALPVATAGEVRPEDAVAALADMERLVARVQPVTLADVADSPLLRGAHEAGFGFVVAVPLLLPDAGRGALLLFSRYRTLFVEDDVRLLADLGTVAAILAGRGTARAEQERLATELAASVRALSAASQAKSDFLSSMSHELRTPLNAIIGFSDLMRGEAAAEPDRRSVPVEWVEHVYSSGRHLLDLINEILDLSKIEAGRMELHRDVLDLSEVITDVVTTLSPLVQAKALRLTTAVPPITIKADPQRLRQVLNNLLSNAIKFTPAEGRIHVGVTTAANEVQILVEDNGAGIAGPDHERVFEEFRQVGDPNMHQAGTGLGLALARRLVRAHGGRIELESELGRGARFTVHLPILAAHHDDEAWPDGLTQPRILLIEDDPSAAQLLRTYLETAGYAVVVAYTGEEGIALARRGPPDAVLLDLQLPGIDGWEVLRRFQRDARLRTVPVLVVTVLDEPHLGLALGAVDHIIKPIDRNLLLTRLAERLAVPAQNEACLLAFSDDPVTLEVIGTRAQPPGTRAAGAP